MHWPIYTIPKNTKLFKLPPYFHPFIGQVREVGQAASNALKFGLTGYDLSGRLPYLHNRTEYGKPEISYDIRHCVPAV